MPLERNPQAVRPITGGFDLSVGAVLALAGVAVGRLLHAGVGVTASVALTLFLAKNANGGGDMIRLIVRTRPGDRAVLKEAFRRHGKKFNREHHLISALALEVPARDVDAMAQTPGVLSISHPTAQAS